METTINVKVSIDEMEQRLKQVFKAEHKDLMTECLMDLFQDQEANLETVFKSSLGIRPTIEYAVGDEVIVKLNSLTTYYMDKAKSETEGYVKDGNVIGVIKKIKKFHSFPYNVEYKFICKDKGTERSYDYEITNKAIVGYKEEFPGDEKV